MSPPTSHSTVNNNSGMSLRSKPTLAPTHITRSTIINPSCGDGSMKAIELVRTFADADDVGGIGFGRNRLEFRLADAVAHDAHHGAGRADLGAEQVGDVAAFEQEEVGTPVQDPLDGAIKSAADGAGTIDQRAAMGRVDADRVAEIRHQARQRRALGAVAVEDVGLERRNAARDAMQRIDVERIELARNGDALEA